MDQFLKNQNISLSTNIPQKKVTPKDREVGIEKLTKEKKEEKSTGSKNTFDMETQFNRWLQAEKQRWVDEVGLETAAEPRSKLSQLLAQGAESLLSQMWHVLEVAETGDKGVFRVWVYLESGALTSVKVRVPRVLYVNSRKVQSEKASQGVYKQVKKHLPRDKKALHLYEFTLDEETYQSKQQYLDGFMSSPDVEGVYQTQIPLLFQFVS